MHQRHAGGITTSLWQAVSEINLRRYKTFRWWFADTVILRLASSGFWSLEVPYLPESFSSQEALANAVEISLIDASIKGPDQTDGDPSSAALGWPGGELHRACRYN